MADVREPRGNASPNEIRDNAIEDLAEAVLLQAFHDLRVLRRYGVIAAKGTKVIGTWPIHPNTGKPRDMIDGYTSTQSVEELLLFFKPPTLDMWIILSGRDINPDVVRQKLFLTPGV